MTGFSNYAATSRKMWMLSASSNCRWLSFGATPASIVWTSKLATSAPSIPTVSWCLDPNKKTARQESGSGCDTRLR
jgi:hypothetical protein